MPYIPALGSCAFSLVCMSLHPPRPAPAGANAAAQSSAGLMACELVPSTAPQASAKASAKEDAKAAKQLSEVRARLEAAAAKAGGKKTAGGLGRAKAGDAGKGPAAAGKGGDAGKATFQQRFALLAKDEQMLRVSHSSPVWVSPFRKRCTIFHLLATHQPIGVVRSLLLPLLHSSHRPPAAQPVRGQ